MCIRDRGGAVSRPWDACVNRLLTRGLLVSGCGETEYDALYDLLSSLGIIPTSGSALVRGVSFIKLVISRRISVRQALKLFRKDHRTDYESRVMRLSRQALLSTAEIIKCVEQDVFSLPSERVLMEKVYGDSETTCQNIASLMRNSRSSQAVTLALSLIHIYTAVLENLVPSVLQNRRERRIGLNQIGKFINNQDFLFLRPEFRNDMEQIQPVGKGCTLQQRIPCYPGPVSYTHLILTFV